MDSTSRIGVDTGEVLVLTLARLEDAVDIGSGGVVLAADTVKDVLAKVLGVGAFGVACLEAENVAAHEVVPLLDLHVRAKGVGEYETSERVTALVSTVRVHLSSTVICLEVDLGLVNVADDLDVVRGLHELDTGESASGNETSAAAGLGAPGDGLALDVANDTVGLRRAPDAKVIKAREKAVWHSDCWFSVVELQRL